MKRPPTVTSVARSSRGRRPIAPTTSAAPSVDALGGPVAVCVDRPILSLDRTFTYLLDTASLAGGEAGIAGGAGTGSLVQVPFHGKLVRGWVLGAADEVPTRILSVKKVVSPVRFFDEEMLGVATWVSRRYVAPLAAVLARISPPRVASEEDGGPGPGPAPATMRVDRRSPESLAGFDGYRGAADLLAALSKGAGSFVLRPAPEDEVGSAVAAVAACLFSGRRAVVVVPEASPVPETAQAIVRAFGPRVALFLGGSKRARYRMWLAIQAGAFDVVVGTRPAVFAPLVGIGLVLVSRESHPAHREDRAPYYHVRDVALERSRRAGAVCLLEAICPSSEVAALRLPQVSPARRQWPPVEVVKPGPQGRAPRLLRALRESRRGFILSSLPGYGVAAVCRACGAAAACAVCGGLLRSEEGSIRCVVCEAPGQCRECGASSFGVRRGGAESVEEWAGRVSPVPVHRLAAGDTPRLPRDGEILVGGPDDIRDLGSGGLDLVAVLDVDLAERLPGLSARERALTTWMEAAAWASPSGRAIVQSTRPGDPAVQSLVRGKPDLFHVDEAARRAEAGFPVGAAVFRVAGAPGLEDELARLEPLTLLVSRVEGQTVCLLALEPDRVPGFGRAVREMATRDAVSRVEAEPHL